MKHWLLATLLFACGGSKGQNSVPPDPDPPPADSGVDAGSLAVEPTSSSELSEEECSGLFEHIFEIAMRQQQTLPEEERPIAADVEVAKGKLRARVMQQCVGSDRVEASYDCAMKASNQEELQGCMGAE